MIEIDGYKLGCPICGKCEGFSMAGHITTDGSGNIALVGPIKFACGGDFEGLPNGNYRVIKSCRPDEVKDGGTIHAVRLAA